MVAAHPLIAAILLALAVTGVKAHPFHASYAELEWSAAGDRLRVALRVIPEDLETALSRGSGRRIVLDPADLPREAIEGYLDRHFLLLPAAGEPPAAELIGAEVAHDATWLYFTLAARRGEGPFMLRNTVLTDVGEGQTNRVRRLWAPAAPLLVFTAREPRQHLSVNNEVPSTTGPVEEKRP